MTPRVLSKSEQARADSRCDAETLVLVYREHFRGRRYSYTQVAAAQHHGRRVVDTRPWLGGDPYLPAVFAAHAAFRACPGLRGSAE